MTENSVIDALKSLVTSDKNRSAASRLFAMIDELETVFSAGVSRSAVLQVLNNHGFNMTLKSFDSTLHRIRKKRGKLATTTNTTSATQNPLTIEKPVATQASTPEPAAQQTEKKAAWMSPAEIRRLRQKAREETDRDFESYSN